MDSIIFDLDGTLWDSRKVVAKAWTEVIKRTPYAKGEVTEEHLRGTMGLQIREISKKLFPYLDEEHQMKLITECCKNEQMHLKEEGGELYDGLERTLEKLSQNYKLYIVSNCGEGYIETFYSYHKLDKYFLDFENPGRTKLSKGENIQLIMERNNLKNPVYVGDTQGDRDAAVYAGIQFVYAKYGFGNVDGFDYEIDGISDLLTIF